MCVCVCSWCSHLIGGIPSEEFSEVRSEQSSYDILNGAVLRCTLLTTDCVSEGQEGKEYVYEREKGGKGRALELGRQYKKIFTFKSTKSDDG